MRAWKRPRRSFGRWVEYIPWEVRGAPYWLRAWKRNGCDSVFGEDSPVSGRREPKLTPMDAAVYPLNSDQPGPPVIPPEPAAGSPRPSPARRFALLAVLGFALVVFVARMSSEEGQDEVMETAQPIIESVNKVTQGLRRLVVAEETASESQAPRVDWAPPPRPVAVSLGDDTQLSGAPNGAIARQCDHNPNGLGLFAPRAALLVAHWQ